MSCQLRHPNRDHESPAAGQLTQRHRTLSRSGALALVGGGTLLIGVLTAGQTVGGFTRQFALLLPRGRNLGGGPNTAGALIYATRLARSTVK